MFYPNKQNSVFTTQIIQDTYQAKTRKVVWGLSKKIARQLHWILQDRRQGGKGWRANFLLVCNKKVQTFLF